MLSIETAGDSARPAVPFSSVWQLRSSCPRCERSSLCLVACPRCAHVAVVCAAEGIAFPSFTALGAGGASQADTLSCDACRQARLHDFPPASLAQIRAAGIDPEECAPLAFDELLATAGTEKVSGQERRERFFERHDRLLSMMRLFIGVALVLGLLTAIGVWIMRA